MARHDLCVDLRLDSGVELSVESFEIGGEVGAGSLGDVELFVHRPHLGAQHRELLVAVTSPEQSHHPPSITSVRPYPTRLQPTRPPTDPEAV